MRDGSLSGGESGAEGIKDRHFQRDKLKNTEVVSVVIKEWGGVGWDCGVVTYRGTAVTIQEGNTGGLANSGWKKVLETSVGGYRHKNVGSQKEHQSCKARLMEETTGGKHWRAK